MPDSRPRKHMLSYDVIYLHILWGKSICYHIPGIYPHMTGHGIWGHILGIYRHMTSYAGICQVIRIPDVTHGMKPFKNTCTGTYPVIPCMYRYMSVRKSCTDMYEYMISVLVCTRYVLYSILQCKYVPVCTCQGQGSFFWV